MPDGFEGDPEDLRKALEARDPYEKRLKAITHDSRGIGFYFLFIFSERQLSSMGSSSLR